MAGGRRAAGARADARWRRSTAIRSFQAHRQPSQRLLWNRVAALRLADDRAEPGGDRARWSRRHRPRDARRSGIEMVLVRGRLREPRRHRARAGCCASSARPAAASWSRSTTRRTEPLQPLRRGRASGSSRPGAAATLHPAEIVKLLAPAAPRMRGRPPAAPATSSSTTSTTTGASSPSTARRRPTRPASSSALIRNFTERYPEGMLRVSAARRSDAGARLARRAGVPADHRRARPRRGARRPARVVRALRRREDRDGQRHREHGLDRRGAAADRRVHAGRAARSTSSSPASTSARSRTGTPRRRCSCTRAASWS